MSALAKSALLLVSLVVFGLPAARAQENGEASRARQGSSGVRALPQIAPAASKSHLDVAWKDEKLTVSAERTPLSAVLLSVVRNTGAEVRGLDKVKGQVSLELPGVSL